MQLNITFAIKTDIFLYKSELPKQHISFLFNLTLFTKIIKNKKH